VSDFRQHLKSHSTTMILCCKVDGTPKGNMKVMRCNKKCAIHSLRYFYYVPIDTYNIIIYLRGMRISKRIINLTPKKKLATIENEHRRLFIVCRWLAVSSLTFTLSSKMCCFELNFQQLHRTLACLLKRQRTQFMLENRKVLLARARELLSCILTFQLFRLDVQVGIFILLTYVFWEWTVPIFRWIFSLLPYIVSIVCLHPFFSSLCFTFDDTFGSFFVLLLLEFNATLKVMLPRATI
jgi:hypothetical protein